MSEPYDVTTDRDRTNGKRRLVDRTGYEWTEDAAEQRTSLTEADVRARVEDLVVKAGSLRALAREWDVSPSYLSDFLTGRRGPGAKILGLLGLVPRITVEYVPGVAKGRRQRARRSTS